MGYFEFTQTSEFLYVVITIFLYRVIFLVINAIWDGVRHRGNG